LRKGRRLALSLLERSRDIRPLVRLVQIEAGLHGIAGLCGALGHLSKYCSEHWESLNPPLAQDGEALRVRRQAFSLFREKRVVAAPLEDAEVFVAGDGVGSVCVRDFLVAAGKRQATSDGRDWDQVELWAAIESAEATSLVEEHAKALGETQKYFAAISEIASKAFDPPLDLSPLGDALANCTASLKLLEDHQAEAPNSEEANTVEVKASEATMQEEEAAKLLDTVIGYYAQTAPESPIGLVLLKIRDLQNASFVEWVAATGGKGVEKAEFDFSGADVGRMRAVAAGDRGSLPASDEKTERAQKAIEKLRSTASALQAIANEKDEFADKDDQATKAIVEATIAIRKKISTELKQFDSWISILEGSVGDTAASTPDPQRAVSTEMTRSSVKQALERLAAHHRRRDPGSAVPLILNRCKNLVDASFTQILGEFSVNGDKLRLGLGGE